MTIALRFLLPNTASIPIGEVPVRLGRHRAYRTRRSPALRMRIIVRVAGAGLRRLDDLNDRPTRVLIPQIVVRSGSKPYALERTGNRDVRLAVMTMAPYRRSVWHGAATHNDLAQVAP